jgi:hypothetical protein
MSLSDLAMIFGLPPLGGIYWASGLIVIGIWARWPVDNVRRRAETGAASLTLASGVLAAILVLAKVCVYA